MTERHRFMDLVFAFAFCVAVKTEIPIKHLAHKHLKCEISRYCLTAFVVAAADAAAVFSVTFQTAPFI